MTFEAFMAKVFAVVIQPLLVLLFGVAFVVFVWGVFAYIRDSDDAKGRAEGQRSILWGLLGMVIMTSSFGILSIIQGTLGLRQTPEQLDVEGQFAPVTGDVRVEGKGSR